MNRIAVFLSATILISGLLCTRGVGAQPAQEEIVLIHEIRTAFYEPAPRSLIRAMSRAVNSWCASDSRDLTKDTLSWLCGAEDLTYFRSVHANGYKGTHGLICEDYGTKYYGMDHVSEAVSYGSCVRADRYNESEYELYVEEVEQ